MKTKSIRNTEASHRFIRSYMAAHEITTLNLVEKQDGLLNHGHGMGAYYLRKKVPCVLPIDLRGHKPAQADRGLTYQPFAAL